DLEMLLEICGGAVATAGGPAWLQSGKAMRVSLSSGNGAAHGAEARVGVAGQLARRVAEKFKLKHDVWLAELQLAPLVRGFEAHRAARQFTPLPRFPAVERDFSLLMDDAVTFDRVTGAIRGLGIAELDRIEALDLF